MGVRSGMRAKSKGKARKYLTDEDFCQCFLRIRWIVGLASNQAFLPLSFGCLRRNQKIRNNCPLPLIDLIDSITHYKPSLLALLSNSSPTIQIQFVHWTLFPCPLTALRALERADFMGVRSGTRGNGKGKVKKYLTQNFHGNWRLWNGPCSFLSSWISRRLPRTNGRAPRQRRYTELFFSRISPASQNYPELFKTVPQRLQNYLKRFWGYFLIPARCVGWTEEMQDCKLRKLKVELGISGASTARFSHAREIAKLDIEYVRAFSIVAHFDPTSCSPLITSNRFWNVLCMICEF